MSSGNIASSDARLLSATTTIVTHITPTPAAWGLDAATVGEYTTTQAEFAELMAKIDDPAQKTRAVVALKNAIRKSLVLATRQLTQRIQGSPAVSDAQCVEIGLPRRKAATPWPAPTTAPSLDIDAVTGRIVSARIHDAASGRRSKPAKVQGAVVLSYIGETPNDDLSKWNYQGTVSRARFDLDFSTVIIPPNGAVKVWLTAMWVNAKHTGNACSPVSVLLTSSLAQAA